MAFVFTLDRTRRQRRYRTMSHLNDLSRSAFLRSLSNADARALLHLLACPACAAKALSTLGFRPVEEALAEAELCLADSTDPQARATFCRDLAKLRLAEGRHEEALALFERAASLFEDFDQTEDQAAAWLAEGDLCLRLGDFGRALECFESTGLLALEGIDPSMILRAARGAAAALLEQGLVVQAREVLRAAVEQQGAGGTLLEWADLAWIEACIAARRSASAALPPLPEDDG
jgi:tetratricopeptide (TPR) repeat protein